MDVEVLFGSKLPQLGHRIDGAFQSRDPSGAYRTRWGIGEARVAGRVAATGTWSRINNGCRRYWNVATALLRVRSADYDLIQVRDGHLSGLMALAAARLAQLPFVYWMSFPVAQHRMYRGTTTRGARAIFDRLLGTVSKGVLRRVLLPRAEHVFVQSLQMVADLAKWGVSPRNMTTVPMGVDPSTTRPTIVEKPGQERWIGYLGTLDRLRNVDMIVEALALIRMSHPDTHLILAGGADLADTEFLNRRIAELGVEDKVLLTGQRSRAEALGYMHACEVCLSPYGPLPILQSTSPTKLVEYMFLAKPVVASEHPEQREVIEASGGGICVKHDPTAFAEATIALLDDPKRRAEMGARGRAYVLRHRTYDKIAADVDRQYRRLFSV